MRSIVKQLQPSVNQLNFTFFPGLCASESLVSRFTRWIQLHQVNAPELLRLLNIRSLDVHMISPVLDITCSTPMPETSVSMTEHILNGKTHPEMCKSRHPLQKLGILMGLTRSQFLAATGSNETEPGVMLMTQTKQLRFCPSCLNLGFHSIYFQYPGASDCPYHGDRLRNVCAFCKQPNFPTIRSLAASPASCWNCGRRWDISNSQIRNDSLLASITTIGAMIDSRICNIKPISSEVLNKFGSFLTSGHLAGSCFPEKEMVVQARRWTCWNDDVKQDQNGRTQIVSIDETAIESQSDLVPLGNTGLRCAAKLDGFWTSSPETTVRANEVLSWLSQKCSFRAEGSFRLRAEIGMQPQGRCINSSINIVHVALLQTMLTYGRQQNHNNIQVDQEIGAVDVYADVRWNHLQLSRYGPVENAANPHLIEGEILGWFALSLVRARGMKFSLEVAWPWHLNPWQCLPSYRTVRTGSAWAVQYRSRVSRSSVARLISRYQDTYLSATHLQELRQALQMSHIDTRKYPI